MEIFLSNFATSATILESILECWQLSIFWILIRLLNVQTITRELEVMAKRETWAWHGWRASLPSPPRPHPACLWAQFIACVGKEWGCDQSHFISVSVAWSNEEYSTPPGLPPTLDSMLPILTPGWREALWASDLPKNTTRCFRPGLEPVPLVAWLNIPQLKQGNIRVTSDVPQFSKQRVFRKIFEGQVTHTWCGVEYTENIRSWNKSTRDPRGYSL